MAYIFLSIISVTLALIPVQISLLGRCLALLGASSTLMYGLALAGVNDSETGLAAYAVVESDLLTAQGVSALMFLGLAVYAAFGYRRYTVYLSRPIKFSTVPGGLSVGLILMSIVCGVYVIYGLGFETMYSYEGYGSIKALNVRFESDAIGRVVTGAFRPVTILLIGVSVANLGAGKRKLVICAMPSILFAVALGLVEGSRVVAIYFSIAAVGLYLIGRSVTALIAVGVAFISVGYALEARTHDILGLAYVPEYLLVAFEGDELVKSILVNLSGGLLLVTSATANVGDSASYGTIYKVLSFLPSIGALDGFQAVKDMYEQRILPYVPFNAFGEAWLFGPGYMVLFWAVLFISAGCVNSASRFGRMPYMILFAIFLLGMMYASQYPVRNSIRYFYVLILLRLLLGWVLGRRGAARLARQDHCSMPEVVSAGARI
ncbi:hypothetical protein J5J83_00070 [Azoarcus sp. L1K30]|uniref:hypothetical protein n=1 Tax=Azoarcus sp. L1K30 TaxID=2820277 RepID=UPI001B822158|nr:hypothetical protein [Azoarcus sp. L1K30]MBR0564505.1 hypothetical protein [Azoarcus sp. L1K30]